MTRKDELIILAIIAAGIRAGRGGDEIPNNSIAVEAADIFAALDAVAVIPESE